METKICTKCGLELPLEDFNWRDKAKGTRRSECKKCHSGYMKQNYQKNKDIVQEIKAKQGCAKCGDIRPYVLDFHHINPENKKERVAKLISTHYSTTNKEIQEEIEKCVVLCANCHREWHYLQERNPELTFENFIQN